MQTEPPRNFLISPPERSQSGPESLPAHTTKSMNNKTTSHKPAAAESAGSQINITALARLAGIPYATTLSAGLAARYGLSPTRPLADRLELYDLVWTVGGSLSGILPAHREQTATGLRWRVEFFSFLSGTADPVSVCLWAALDTTSLPGRLHLSLVDELLEHTS